MAPFLLDSTRKYIENDLEAPFFVAKKINISAIGQSASRQRLIFVKNLDPNSCFVAQTWKPHILDHVQKFQAFDPP